MRILRTIPIVFLTIGSGFVYGQDEKGDVFSEAIKKYFPREEPKIEARSNLAKANEHLQNKRWRKSIPFAVKAQKIARENRLNPERIAATNCLGQAYLKLGKYDSARNMYRAALVVAELIDNAELIIKTRNLVAQIYYDQQEFHKYIQLKLPVISLLEEGQDKQTLGSAYNNVGAAFQTTGNYDKALEYYLKALKLFELLDSEGNIAWTLTLISVIHEENHENQKAIDYALRGLALNLAKEVDLEIQTSYLRLASIYRNLYDYEMTHQYYSKALEMARKREVPEHITTINRLIGTAWYDIDSIKLASRYLREALSRAASRDDTIELCLIYAELSKIYAQNQVAKSAYETIDSARAYVTLITSKDVLSLAYREIGTAYEQLSNYTSAIEFYTHALEISLEMGTIETDRNLYDKIIGVYVKENDFEKAFEYQNYYHAVESDMIGSSYDQLQSNYQFERDQEAINIAAVTQQEQKSRRNFIQYLAIFSGICILFLLAYLLLRFKVQARIYPILLFFTFLLFFEFILVVADPIVDVWTDGIPIQKLGFNIVLAVFFTFIHLFFLKDNDILKLKGG